jgi:hypothetical protein
MHWQQYKHAGAETYKSLILVMNCILFSVFVGWCITCCSCSCSTMFVISYFGMVVNYVESLYCQMEKCCLGEHVFVYQIQHNMIKCHSKTEIIKNVDEQLQ